MIANSIDARWFFAGLDPREPNVLAPDGEPLGIDLQTLEPSAATTAVRDRLALAGAASRSGLEQPLDAVRRALSTIVRQGQLRPDADLSVVVVTDEPDTSPGDVRGAAEAILLLENSVDVGLVSLSAVAGPVDRPCEPPQTAVTGPRLETAVALGGGALINLCDQDWGQAFERLPRPAGFPQRFILANDPVSDSIRVFVDGVEIPRRAPNGLDKLVVQLRRR